MIIKEKPVRITRYEKDIIDIYKYLLSAPLEEWQKTALHKRFIHYLQRIYFKNHRKLF
jgi:hypothetical protein